MALARVRSTTRESLARAGGAVAVCTLALTAAFVGLLALLSGEAAGVGDRLAAYVLVTAAVFVGAIVLLESYHWTGRAILVVAAGIAAGSFLFALFGGEGLVYALRYPDRVVASQVFLYVLAAGMIATGLGYWGVRHWRELAAGARRRSEDAL